jgi:hypothetical protein
VNKLQSVCFRLSFVPALLVSSWALFALPWFAEMYRAFDAPLGFASRLLLQWPLVFGALPFMYLLGWHFWPDKATQGVVALATSAIWNLLLLAFGTWAAYAPLRVLAAGGSAT